MKKQSNQIIFLLTLLVVWAVVAWRLKVIGNTAAQTSEAAKAKATKTAQQDNPLTARFHRVRNEMDALYHYRIKPVPFDTTANPFRMPPGLAMLADESKASAPEANAKTGTPPPAPASAAEFGEVLLRHVISTARIEGVVTLNGVSQININGQLHREGDVFTLRLLNRLVLIRVKYLSTSYVTLALEDPENGTAQQRVQLQ